MKDEDLILTAYLSIISEAAKTDIDVKLYSDDIQAMCPALKNWSNYLGRATSASTDPFAPGGPGNLALTKVKNKINNMIQTDMSESLSKSVPLSQFISQLQSFLNDFLSQSDPDMKKFASDIVGKNASAHPKFKWP